MSGETSHRGVCGRAGAACVAAMVLAGCVTERESPRGRPVRPSTGSMIQAEADRVAARSTPAGEAGALPPGPVGRPAVPVGTSVSHVVVSVVPLGSVPYDGQVLPISSPDGRYLAVEEGEAPDWSALMAAPDAKPVPGSRIAIYDVSSAPAKRVEHSAQASGVMLGRGSDGAGVLVESPREDGSRWIGKLNWTTGEVSWLVQGGWVNAHATFTPVGDLVYTRRQVGSDHGELVLRRRDGAESVRRTPDGSYEVPLACADSSVVFALVRTAAGVDIEAIRIGGATRETRALGATLARRQVVRADDPAMAYQVAGAAAGSAVRSREADSVSSGEATVAIYHPAMRRMASFDARSATFLPLAQDSVAAVRLDGIGPRGWFCTTPKDLVFLPDVDADPGAAKRGTTRILASSLVPRATNDPKRPLIVVGPVRSDPMRLEITAVGLGEPGSN